VKTALALAMITAAVPLALAPGQSQALTGGLAGGGVSALTFANPFHDDHSHMRVPFTTVGRAWSGSAASSPPPRVTIFGDSVPDSLQYVPEARALLASGLDLRLELTSCRRLVSPGCAYQGTRPESVLDIIQFSPLVTLGNVVVVDVGYNESAINYEADMSQVAIALVKLGVEHVLWVTMREQTDNYRQINDIIRTQARRWPQVQVVDWDAASRGQDWFQADGLHLNAAGALGLAKLLRAYILAACGSDCQPAIPSATELPKNVRLPRLRGAPVVGRRLTCSPGTWTGTRPIAYSYRWLRNGRDIPRAFRPSRRVHVSDAGLLLTCQVWAANAAGASEATAKALRARAR
jgi:hypothetical protein